jgi:hypothetical protein
MGRGARRAPDCPSVVIDGFLVFRAAFIVVVVVVVVTFFIHPDITSAASTGVS